MSLIFGNSVFQREENIAIKNTCKGDRTSPSLVWSKLLKGTHSFAPIIDDPDALGDAFIHWPIYDIPADVAGLFEAVHDEVKLLNGLLRGQNDSSNIKYEAPCPLPNSTHRYRFTIYALNQILGLQPGTTKA